MALPVQDMPGGFRISDVCSRHALDDMGKGIHGTEWDYVM